jgi:hypothetical protein
LTPLSNKTYYKVPSPAEIEQLADNQVPLGQLIADWPVSTDPSVHVREELDRDLGLLGVRSVDELNPRLLVRVGELGKAGAEPH